jgi:3'-phosphoadenosine 5'-phosphosulfate sulfotransferase (PAPS reductase)/FAD synthetase
MTVTLPVLQNPQWKEAPALHLKSSNEFPALAITPEIEQMLAEGANIGSGVSGGGDSDVLAHLVEMERRRRGYSGKHVLVYADLGEIAWRGDQPQCQHIANQLGLELIVVKSDMIGRWEKRWMDNQARYRALQCVKIIMPWSGPGLLRFCTSETKISPITQELVRRFPNSVILSGSGIRHDESQQRKNAPIYKVQSKLWRVKANTRGYDWHPLIEWTKRDVFRYHQVHHLPLHPAYSLGCSRVSCPYCVVQGIGDKRAALLAEETHPAYRRICRLEINSSFSFQAGLWLSDLAPHLLDQEVREEIPLAKERARQRALIEARIPVRLLYEKGWPACIPTWEEAALLAEIRQNIARINGLAIDYSEPAAIITRFTELMEIQRQREEEKTSKRLALPNQVDPELRSGAGG